MFCISSFFTSIGGVVLVNLSGSEKSAGKHTIGIYLRVLILEYAVINTIF